MQLFWLIVTSGSLKVDCLYCSVHFTKQRIGISNDLILIRMLIILFCVAKEMFWCVFPLSFKNLLGDIMASKRDYWSCFIKRGKTDKETSSSTQKVPLLFNLLQTLQVKRRSSIFNRKWNKLLNPLNTTRIFHQK